jgi:hypothetical protein
MAKKTKLIIVKPEQSLPAPQQTDSIDLLITKAIEHNASIETMERILAMRQQLRAERAKEAFDNDMAGFQGECPTIKKSKAGGVTDGGVIAYYYAPIDVIVEQTKSLISKYGFSYAIKTETAPGKVKSICIVKHRMGHSESSEMEVPLGTKTRVMSDPQVVAAASTFTKRYAFCNAFGIMTGDEDKDAQDIPTEQPKEEPKPKAKPTLEETINGIRGVKDPKTLETFRNKIASSKAYSDNQKRVLLQNIDEQIKLCSPQGNI